MFAAAADIGTPVPYNLTRIVNPHCRRHRASGIVEFRQMPLSVPHEGVIRTHHLLRIITADHARVIDAGAAVMPAPGTSNVVNEYGASVIARAASEQGKNRHKQSHHTAIVSRQIAVARWNPGYDSEVWLVGQHFRSAHRLILMRLPILLAAAAVLNAQNPPQPSFEVASLKLLGSSMVPGFSMSPRRTGNRLKWNTNAALLIRYAFNMPYWRISGAKLPDGFYQIDATFPASATDEQVRLMFRTLLAQRLNFEAHRETEQRDVYSLVAGRNGPKIKPATIAEKLPPLPKWFSTKGDDFAQSIDGKILLTMEGQGINAITGRGVTMAQLASSLEEALQNAVTDKTNLSGKYYFGVLFTREGIAPAADGTLPDTPSVFTAVQEELGLRLEKQKGQWRFSSSIALTEPPLITNRYTRHRGSFTESCRGPSGHVPARHFTWSCGCPSSHLSAWHLARSCGRATVHISSRHFAQCCGFVTGHIPARHFV